MNRMSRERRAQVVAALVEGNSIRATCRITGAAKNTVTKLLVDLGRACASYQDEVLRDLPCTRIEADEIWSFVYAKKKNVPKGKATTFGYGDVWTYTAICADTKLVPCWMLGERHADAALAFMRDLASRMANRIQLTTDGHTMYLEAVEGAFGMGVDYAQLVKLYGKTPDDRQPQRRYSPAVCLATERRRIQGDPNEALVSTSYVERQNLTMRMGMRRFTRLTNGFSKKVENLAAAVALHFMHYNFCRPHRSIRTRNNNRVTPAMAAGLTSSAWSLETLVELLELREVAA